MRPENVGTPTHEIVLAAIQDQGGRLASPSRERLTPQAGTVFVVGYVRWDHSLLQTLDAVGRGDCSDLILFDLDAFLTQEAVEVAFPGLALVTQSPVVGKFVDGKLSWKKEGREVLDWFASKEGLNGSAGS